MKLYVITSAYYTGSTDEAYLHGVYSNQTEAEKVLSELNSSTSTKNSCIISVVELGATVGLLPENADKFGYGIPGIRLV